MKFCYYPGCTLKTYALELEVTALAIAKRLGIEFLELEKWYCCGAVPSLTLDNLAYHLGAYRNLLAAQEKNCNILTLCDLCYNTLSHTNLLVKHDPKAIETINKFLELENTYKGKVEVHHLLGVLRDSIGFEKLKDYVKVPLRGLKVAPYYGCMLLRPKELSIDEPEEPTILKELLVSLGAEPVENIYCNECCGAYHIVDNRQLVARRVEKILSRLGNCDALVVSCPLCRFNFDTCQNKNFKVLPIFYFTQLIALAFDLKEKYYGLERHKIDPRPLLKEKKLI